MITNNEHVKMQNAILKEREEGNKDGTEETNKNK